MLFEPMKKMHLPLPDDLHERLKREARLSERPATALAREAVAAWLERRERERFAEELRVYAERFGGSDLDLDPDFERAAAEFMTQGSE